MGKPGSRLCEAPKKSSLAQALVVLSLARKVRSSCTIACVSCDLKKQELHVQFKERQSAGDADLHAHLSKRHDLSIEKVD